MNTLFQHDICRGRRSAVRRSSCLNYKACVLSNQNCFRWRPCWLRQDHTVGRAVVLLLGTWCLWRSQAVAQAPYVDLTQECGLPTVQPSELNGIGGNIGTADFDRDGRLDLVFSMGQSAGVALYRNVGAPGTPKFVDETNLRGLSGNSQTTIGIAIGDFDGNGWDDLFFANIGTNELFLNQNGSFERVTTTHLEGQGGFFSGVAVGDLDVDGDLDLVVGRYIAFASWPFHRGGPDLVLLNDGTGRFSDVAAESGALNEGAALSTLLTDMNGDGVVDIVTANDFGPLAIPSVGFRNLGLDEDGILRFSQVEGESEAAPRVYGMGIARIDLDQDGILDTFFSSIGRNHWFRGEDGAFWGKNVTDDWGAWTEFGANSYRAAWAPVVVDLTGDGHEDLWLRAGQMVSTWFLTNDPSQPDIAWTLGADGTVDRIETSTLGALPEAGRGAVAADIDGDGRVDLWAGSAHEGPFRLLMGAGPISSLAITLVTTVSAPGGFGARFWLHCGSSVFVHDGASGGAFASAGPPGRWWLGRPAVCNGGGVVEVRWPSGIRTSTPFAAETSDLTVTEPRWWWVDDERSPPRDPCIDMMLMPPAKNGTVVASGAVVQVGLVGAQPISATDVGNGQYHAKLCPPESTGPWPLMVWVNGEPLSAHPVVGMTTPTARLITYPKFVRKLSPTSIYIHYPGGTDLGLNVSGGIYLVGAKTAPDVLTAQILPFDNATSMTLELTDGGVVSDKKWQLPVYPAVVADMSHVAMNSPYITTWSGGVLPMHITVWPRDIMGSEVGGDPFPVRVYVDGVLVSEQATSPWTSATQIVVPGDMFGDQSVVSVAVGNDVVIGPVTIKTLDSVEQWNAVQSPQLSELGFGFATCRAGGEDQVVVLYRPRDDSGHLLPLQSVLSDLEVHIAGQGPAPLVTPFLLAGSHAEAVFHCPMAPGTWTVELALAGVPLGIKRQLIATPVPNLDPQPKTCAVSVYESSGVTPLTVVRLGPRTVDGDRAGCGLVMSLWEPQTQSCLQLPYCGMGDYCLTLSGCCSDFRQAEVYADGTSLEQFVNIPSGPYPLKHSLPAEACGQDTKLPDSDANEPDSRSETTDQRSANDLGREFVDSDAVESSRIGARDTTTTPGGPDNAESDLAQGLKPDGQDSAAMQVHSRSDDGCTTHPGPVPWFWLALILHSGAGARSLWRIAKMAPRWRILPPRLRASLRHVP